MANKSLKFFIFIWLVSCKSYSKLDGKWVASFQESFITYKFKNNTCIETYDNPQGKVSIIKYIYEFKGDTLYLHKLNSGSIIEKYFVVFDNNNIVKFDNMILQKYSKLNKTKPIMNKPNF